MHSVSLPKPGPEPTKPPEVRVTIAIASAIIVQSALALIWAGAASERLAQLERRAEVNAAIIERTVRLEEQVRFVSTAVQRIEKKIDRSLMEDKP